MPGTLTHFHLMLLFLLFFCSQGSCPRGTFLKGKECKNCSESCLQCVSESQCIQCTPQRGLYQGQCIRTCPPSTFPIFNHSVLHVNCQQPLRIIKENLSEVIVPFSEPVDYLKVNPEFILINRPSDLLKIGITGWARLAKENNITSSFMEIYGNSRKLILQVVINNGSVELINSGLEAEIRWENGIWKRFIVKFTWPNNLDDLDSLYVFIGGAPSQRFPGLLKGVSILRSVPFTEYQRYGMLETVLHRISFISEQFSNLESVSVHGNKTYSVDFEMNSHISLKFSVVFNEQSTHSIYQGCTIFEVRGHNDTNAILSLRMARAGGPLIICTLNCSKIEVESMTLIKFEIELIYHNDIKELIMKIFDREFTRNNFFGGNMSLIFGENGENSCSFRPFNILVYEGELGYFPEESGQCKSRDVYNKICLDCTEGMVFDLKSDGCVKETCSDEVCPLSIQQAIPFCLESYQGKCTSCKAGYHLTRNGYCIIDCPVNQCSIPISQNEFGCTNSITSHCKECFESNSLLSCYQCQEGFMLHNNSCVQSCGNLIEFNGQCHSSCPIGYYFDEVKKTCNNCSNNCLSCENSFSCDSCKIGNILVNDKCIPEHCTQKILDSSSVICPPCPRDCSECEIRNGDIHCLKCQIPLLLFNGSCGTSCPPGYLPNTVDRICLPCRHYILFNNGSKECLPFFGGAYFDFFDGEVSYYRECPEGCLFCLRSLDTKQPACTRCKEGWLLQHEGCVKRCSIFHNWRYETCELKELCDRSAFFSYDKSDRQCRLCHTKFPFTLRYQLNRCLKSSQNLQNILIIKEDDCTICDHRCKICEQGFKCTECWKGYFLTHQSVCRKTCPLGFYPDSNLKTCMSCPEPCAACWGPTLCYMCKETYVLSNFTCGHSQAKPSESFILKLSLMSNLWPYSLIPAWKSQELNKWKPSLKVEPLVEAIPCPTLDFDETMYQTLIINKKYTTLWKNCEHNYKLLGSLIEGDCDKSCLICTGGASQSKPTCLQCIPQFFDTEIIENRCACPLSRKFLDRVSGRCVSACPPGSYIIFETNECVPSCAVLSLFTDELTIFNTKKYCVTNCIDGFRAEIDPDNPVYVNCVEMLSHKAYLQLNSTIREMDPFFYHQCEQGNECFLSHSIQINQSTLDKVNDYIQIISGGENIYDISQQPDAFIILSLHSMDPSVHKDPDRVQNLLHLINLMAYQCTNSSDAFSLILSLDNLLANIKISMEDLKLMPQIFEGLTQCFEKILEAEHPHSIPSLRGEILSCDFLAADDDESKVFHLDNNRLSLHITKVSFYQLDLNILYCSIKTPESLSIESTHFLGIVVTNALSSWWEVHLRVDFNYEETGYKLLGWENGNWAHKKFERLEKTFSTVSQSKSISILVKAEASDFSSDSHSTVKRSSLMAYLMLGGISVLLILSGVFTIKNFSSQINKKKTRCVIEEESVVELQSSEPEDDQI